MTRKRRELPAFSLSFLDVMSCGLGAVVLLFLIVRHNANVQALLPETPDLRAEVNLLDEEILDGKEGLVELRNTIDEVQREIVIAEGLSRRIMEDIRERQGDTEADRLQSAEREIEALREQIAALEKRKEQVEAEKEQSGSDTRAYEGEARRQYLTGLQVEGNRILILMDTSASMLDKTLVNVIRRRNMTDSRRTASNKWRQAVATTDWLTAQLPSGGSYQLYTFNTSVTSAVPGTEGRWLPVSDIAQLNGAVEKVRMAKPDGGTSLVNAFAAVAAMKPRPDNVYLVTDGLPTQGTKPARDGAKVSGKERERYFREAIERLPGGVPVNTILLPMEGDPMAAFSFWGLSVMTQGTLLSPAEDWP